MTEPIPELRTQANVRARVHSGRFEARYRSDRVLKPMPADRISDQIRTSDDQH